MRGYFGGSIASANDDMFEVVGEGLEEYLKRKKLELQSFDRKLLRNELALVPYNQIETYQNPISPIDEERKNNLLVK